MGKLIRYLGRRNRRPILPSGYHRHDHEDDSDRPSERAIIARRLARTPAAARDLIEKYGSVEAVLEREHAPKRKEPPIFRRLWRFVRFWFPGG